jgi:LL-diaminopimelate aminotransferase
MPCLQPSTQPGKVIMINPAQRMQPFSAHFFAERQRKLNQLQARGCDVIRLDVGSPDLPPHDAIIQALSHSAALPDRHGYQPHNGPPALRAAWAEMYRRLYRVDLDSTREITPLLGSKEGIFNLSMALLDPGDVALIPDPGYITYTRGAQFAGARAYYFPLLEAKHFLPDLQSIPSEIAFQAKILWLNYPNNPTSAVAGMEFFKQAVDFAREHDLLLCHDAAYSQVTYSGVPAPSVLQVPGAKSVAVEFNSLSKSHNMAGWRVAAALGNQDALQALYRLKTNLDSGHFLPVMEAAIQAMNGDQEWLVARNQVYRRRRDIVLEGLSMLGLKGYSFDATLYVWSPVPEGWDSVAFSEMVLETANISLTPGNVFGKRGEGYMRISLSTPEKHLEQAMQRMARRLRL